MTRMIAIRPIAATEWPTYRTLRLRSLQDSPDAFGSTYEAEKDRPDAMWQSRLESAARSGNDHALFAENAGDVCGLVWCKRFENEPEIAHIFQMWVAPAARGLGAGDALLRTAIEWAAKLPVKQVRLGVTSAESAQHSPAMRLYQKHGFVAVGELEPLREGSELMSQPMVLIFSRTE